MKRLQAIKMFLSLLWRKTGYFPEELDYRIGWKQAWDMSKGWLNY